MSLWPASHRRQAAVPQIIVNLFFCFVFVYVFANINLSVRNPDSHWQVQGENSCSVTAIKNTPILWDGEFYLVKCTQRHTSFCIWECKNSKLLTQTFFQYLCFCCFRPLIFLNTTGKKVICTTGLKQFIHNISSNFNLSYCIISSPSTISSSKTQLQIHFQHPHHDYSL